MGGLSTQAERHRTGAAQRNVIVGIGAASIAALAVWVIVGPGDPPPDPSRPPPPSAEPADTPSAPRESTADVVLVSGQDAEPVSTDRLPEDAPVSIDLALPVSLEGESILWARVISVGREPLELDGAIRGEKRDTIRLEVPAGWLEPGIYLIEVKTSERTPIPLRRFMLEVD